MKISLRNAILAIPILLAACAREGPLTEEIARGVIEAQMPASVPAYAEVPQRVWWGPDAPKDDYDEKALRTLRNLERAGLVTVEHSENDGNTVYTAKTTDKGFPVLGTVPSARGPAFRAMIAVKKYVGLRNFQQHPTDPTVGRGELLWHYEQPTPSYELFETKIDKPLNEPFVSIISFHWDSGWQFEVIVEKAKASEIDAPHDPSGQ